MKASASSIYPEVGCFFKVSHRVDNYIIATIEEIIMKPYGLDKIDSKLNLSLRVTTRSDVDNVKVIAPDGKNRNNCIVWSLALPYSKIEGSDKTIQSYLDYYFEAAEHVFSHYEVNSSDVLKVKGLVEQEVLGNSAYDYIESDDGEVDLSDIDFDD